MFHRDRTWNVGPAGLPSDLAEKLTQHSWTLCTGFELEGYLFLNDSTSEDGAGEWAVVKRRPDGSFVQVESITFGWCTYARAAELIHRVIMGGYDADCGLPCVVTPKIQDAATHGRCMLCA